APEPTPTSTTILPAFTSQFQTIDGPSFGPMIWARRRMVSTLSRTEGVWTRNVRLPIRHRRPMDPRSVSAWTTPIRGTLIVSRSRTTRCLRPKGSSKNKRSDSMTVRTRPQRKAFRLSGETLMGLRRFRSRQTDHGRHTGTESVVGGASKVAALGASTHRAIPGATRAGGSRRSRRGRDLRDADPRLRHLSPSIRPRRDGHQQHRHRRRDRPHGPLWDSRVRELRVRRHRDPRRVRGASPHLRRDLSGPWRDHHVPPPRRLRRLPRIRRLLPPRRARGRGATG